MNEEQRTEYKEVKQQLSAVQLKIKKALGADGLPESEDAALFLQLAEKKKTLSPPEWQEVMDVFNQHLESFRCALTAKDAALAKEAFAGLMDAKAEGHAQFRKR